MGIAGMIGGAGIGLIIWFAIGPMIFQLIDSNIIQEWWFDNPGTIIITCAMIGIFYGIVSGSEAWVIDNSVEIEEII